MTDEMQMSDLPLTSILSHEMLTPLALIKGANEMLLEEERYDVTLKKLCLTIREGERRLSQLIGNMLLAFEIETGLAQQRFEAEKTKAEVPLCIEAAVRRSSPAALRRDMTIVTSLQNLLEESVPVVAHPGQLVDALVCLLDNAIKFSKPGSRVQVCVEAEDRRVGIAVRDKGTGIPADEIPLLFRVFHQVDRRKNEQRGIGLGLFIARRLIEIQGGDIEVKSKFGEGSTFTIVLPGSGE